MGWSLGVQHLFDVIAESEGADFVNFYGDSGCRNHQLEFLRESKTYIKRWLRSEPGAFPGASFELHFSGLAT